MYICYERLCKGTVILEQTVNSIYNNGKNNSNYQSLLGTVIAAQLKEIMFR